MVTINLASSSGNGPRWSHPLTPACITAILCVWFATAAAEPIDKPSDCTGWLGYPAAMVISAAIAIVPAMLTLRKGRRRS